MTTLTPEESLSIREAGRAIVAQVERAIVGKKESIELLTTALLAGGHVLVEDIPGVGKTTLAKAMAQAVGGIFKRIQFTPDLLPGDVTGLAIYNQKTTEFVFTPGPIFANVVLADEINRATPKTQSALLEAMQESQVTIDGVTHALPKPFFVVATQNPIEYRGTYPLPEAQMDRFMMRLSIGYPQPGEESLMLARHSEAALLDQPGGGSVEGLPTPLDEIETVLSAEGAHRLQQLVRRVHVAQPVRDYIVAIAHNTRIQNDVSLGISPRGSLALQRAAQALAALSGREFVTPDDIKRLTLPVLAHRLTMSVDSGRRQAAESLLERLLHELPVPSMTS